MRVLHTMAPLMVNVFLCFMGGWFFFLTKINKASGSHFVQAQASEFFHKIDAENVSLSFLLSFFLFTFTRAPLCFL